MTKAELLAKIQEICPEAMIHEGEDTDSEIFIATGYLEPEDNAELVSIEDHNKTIFGDTDRTVHYFADDGNYGDADGLFIAETTNWTENDWADIEESPDSARLKVAEVINGKYNR